MAGACRQTIQPYPVGVKAPRLDLFGEENTTGLLARLKNENSAWESLRLALAGNDEPGFRPVE